MSAVRKVHAHDGIAGLEHGKVHREIRLRARMGLHVGMLAAEQLFQAIARKIFHNIHKFAAAVIALAGIPLRVLVGQVAAHRRHHRGRDDVFACDEFQIPPLTGKLLFHRLTYFGIGVSDSGEIDHNALRCFFFIITDRRKNSKRTAKLSEKSMLFCLLQDTTRPTQGKMSACGSILPKRRTNFLKNRHSKRNAVERSP